MAKNLIGAICFFGLMIQAAQAQEIKLKFTSINAIGILNGYGASPFAMETINGIRYKSLSTGIGVAVDNYAYRTIPLFIDVRKRFGKHGFQPFVFAEMGVSVPLQTDALPKTLYGQPANDLKNGFYGEWGVGLQKQIAKSCAFFVSVGYSYKQFKYKNYQYYFPVSPDDNEPPYIKYNYSYNRIALRMGVQL
jgi:hypothetical protein